MRNVVILLVAALIVVGGYAWSKNPSACKKLGSDIVRDTKTIYLPSDSADSAPSDAGAMVNSGQPATGTPPAPAPVAVVAPALPVPSAPPAPPAPPPPQHYSMGYVAPQSVAPAPALNAPQNQTATIAPAQPRAAPKPPGGRLPSFTNYDEAVSAARTNQVPVLILFTGSDWCPFCQKLDQEVLSDAQFQDFVSTHFVFLTVDDLHNSPILDDEKKRVSDAEQKYKINTFPTFVITDSAGAEIGRFEGYDPGSGPTSVTNELDQLLTREAKLSREEQLSH